jgi:hypothetical protein
MPFITASKFGPLNWLECFALTTILQGFPIFAAASLMVKLLGDYHGSPPVLTIAMASIFCCRCWRRLRGERRFVIPGRREAASYDAQSRI